MLKRSSILQPSSMNSLSHLMLRTACKRCVTSFKVKCKYRPFEWKDTGYCHEILYHGSEGWHLYLGKIPQWVRRTTLHVNCSILIKADNFLALINYFKLFRYIRYGKTNCFIFKLNERFFNPLAITINLIMKNMAGSQQFGPTDRCNLFMLFIYPIVY